MGSEVKLVRVYAEDWKELNELLLVEQARLKKRLSFADIIHDLIGMSKANVEVTIKKREGEEKGDNTS